MLNQFRRTPSKSRQRRANFELRVRRIGYARVVDRGPTIFVLSVGLANSGEASPVAGWSASYVRGGKEEPMELLYAMEPWVEASGNLVTVHDPLDNLGIAALLPIQPGKALEGRLIFAIDGDRSREIESRDFQIALGLSYPDGGRLTASVDPREIPTERVSLGPIEARS